MASRKSFPKDKIESLPNEETFRLLFANHPVPMWIYDLNTLAFLEVNDAAVEKYGFTREQFLSLTIKDIRPEEDVARLLKNVEQKRPTLQHSGEWRHQLKNGEILDVEITSHTLEFKGRKAALVMAQDITERKQAEATIRESEDRYRDLVEHIQDLIGTHDLQGKILSINPASAKLLGIGQDTLMKMNLRDLLAPEVRGQFDDYLAAIQRDGHASGLMLVQTSTGEKCVWEYANTLRTQGVGEPIVRAMARDVTERNKTEDALRESEKKYHVLTEISPVGIFRTDAQGVTTFVNPRWCQISGLTEEQALGDGWLNALPAEDRERVRANWKLAAERQSASTTEYRFVLPDGSITWVLGQATPEKNSRDQVIGYVGTITDITELKRVEDKLRESERQLKETQSIAGLGSYRLNFPTDRWMSSDVLDGVFGIDEAFERSTEGWAAILHPADRPQMTDYFANEVIAKRQRFDREYRIVRINDGAERWVHGLGELQMDAQDQLVSMLGTIQDITERKQAEEAMQRQLKELVVLHKIASIATQAINVDELIESVTRTISESLYPDTCGVLLFDESENVLRPHPSYRGVTQVENRNISIPSGKGVTGRVAASRKPLRIADLKAESNYINIYEESHSELCVPALIGERLLGVINAESAKLDAFTDSDERLLFTIAGTLATAIEKLRLFESERARRVESETLRQAAAALTTSLELEKILDNLFDALSQVIPYDSAVVFLHEKDRLRAIAGRGFAEPEKIIGQSLPVENWLYQEIVKSRQALIIPDAQVDPHFSGWGESGHVHGWMGIPLIVHNQVIGQLSIDNHIPGIYGEHHAELARAIASQAAVAIENSRLFNDTRQRVKELELLYQSGLTLSQLLTPKEIGEKLLELLEQKLDWHHSAIRLYRPENERFELLAFHQPGLESDAEKSAVAEHFNLYVSKSTDGLTGWAVRQSRTIRSGDVVNDPHYTETFPGIRSGLYTPLKLGERVIGVISIESEKADAFNESDEQLLATLANQAASALENARLFQEINQRVANLETINRISVASRAISTQDAMLAIVLEEALTALNASHGSIELLNKETNRLQKVMARGWLADVIESPQDIAEGIFGQVFISGEIYISREFASDPATRDLTRSQIPSGWGGICLPIHTSHTTLGVLTISVPSKREFNKDEIRLLTTLSEMTGVALQRMQLNSETARRLEHLQTLHTIDLVIASSYDLNQILNTVVMHVLSQLNVDAADILLYSPGLQTLDYAVGQGFRTNLAKSASVRLGNDFAGRVALERRILKVSSSELTPEQSQFASLCASEGFESYFGVPLISKGEIKGVLEVFHRTSLPANPDWLEFLETLAGQAAIAIDEMQLFDGLQRSNLELSLAYDATIEGWSRAMELRDEETEGHTQRVTSMAVDLAKEFGVNDKELLNIRRGALLHDIGKMGVPDGILLKPGKLTDEEWGIMHRHPQFAYDMLQPIAYLRQALDIPYCHHERWDGTGYPRGLKGEQIPLAGRIFAIVDVWDALTNDRPYRKAWTKADTLKHIREQSGIHFDPQVVNKFMDLFGSEES